MRSEIKINNTPKDGLINNIIETEWFFFDNVNNTGGRAWCQDDEWAFYANRYSQFHVFSEQTLESYKADLDLALSEGRNIITEKYAYMMEFTDPAYYCKHLKGSIPDVPSEKENLVNAIADFLVEKERAFEASYPKFAGKGRVLEGSFEYATFRVYVIGELKTYSLKTLVLYLADLVKADKENRNISKEIHEMTAKFYGYRNLEDAENKIK
ncbi:MAG: DUF4125 family protein [Eubacteriales bacterium]